MNPTRLSRHWTRLGLALLTADPVVARYKGPVRKV